MAIEDGTYRGNFIKPALGWWQRGALVSDEQGQALIDADGQRHPFPPGAAVLWDIFQTGEGSANASPGTPRLLLTNAGNTVLLQLPTDGWQTQELALFAEQAGLRYKSFRGDVGALKKAFPNWYGAPSLVRAVKDQAMRERSLGARVGRLLGRKG